MNGRPRLLSAAQEGAFEWHARRLGHEPGRLRGDTEQVSYPVLVSVAALRAVPAATPEQRRRRQAVFFGPPITIRRAIGQGVHDRVEAAVFADGQIGAEDEARAARHFPFPTRILSVRHRVVPAGTCWDLSVRGEYWGLDDRDDILNVVCVGSLCLEPGAIVAVRGNLLILIVQRVICEDASCQVAILPTPFSVDPATGPLHGAAGPAGRDGAAGGAGVAAATEATWLGARLAGPVVPGASDGCGGGDGGPGGNGGKGRTGGAAKLAEITIGELTGPLVLVATAGRGGDGGDGGAGGRGGDGGPGAAGQRTVHGFLPPGRDGDGGHGGSGGHGGNAGNGGISSNVFVSLPAVQAGLLHVRSHPAPGGRGGVCGAGGTAGAAGTRGTAGTPGRGGRPRPAPPVFVNEIPVEPMPGPAEVLPPATVRSLDIRRGGQSDQKLSNRLVRGESK
jgi:hypothetical protein